MPKSFPTFIATAAPVEVEVELATVADVEVPDLLVEVALALTLVLEALEVVGAGVKLAISEVPHEFKIVEEQPA